MDGSSAKVDGILRVVVAGFSSKKGILSGVLQADIRLGKRKVASEEYILQVMGDSLELVGGVEGGA